MKRHSCLWKTMAVAGTFLALVVFSGCAGMEYAPKNSIMYYHKELPAADRAIAAAQQAGKDKECPAEFQAAQKARDEAYQIYWSCRTQEGIAKANEASALAKGLCPVKAAPVEAPPPAAPAPPVPPPPPPPPPAPTVSLSANPPSVDPGKCATLSWSSENTSGATIDQGIGAVDSSGSRQVCPAETTLYTITAAGAGGTSTARTTVTVNPPPKPIDTLTVHINFDTGKATIRKADQAELQKAIDFVKKYPKNKISVEGHTDNVGKDQFNQKLSEQRANAVKKYLVDKGATTGDNVTAAGYGKTRPIADNATKEGKFQNRRVEIVILPE